MWSYKKPTKPGLYYVNRGDVVTQYNLDVDFMVPSVDGGLLSQNTGIPVKDYHETFKFMLVDYEALNKIGNDDEDSTKENDA